MSRISDIVTQIRTAVYGRDVRTNIADGIEICYSNVQEGKTVAENAAEQAVNTANTAATQAVNTANTAATQAVNTANTAATQALNTANTAATNANEKASIAQTAANAANEAAQEAQAAASLITDSFVVPKEYDGGYIKNGNVWNTYSNDWYNGGEYAQYTVLKVSEVHGHLRIVSCPANANVPAVCYFSGEPSSSTYLGKEGYPSGLSVVTISDVLCHIPDGCSHIIIQTGFREYGEPSFEIGNSVSDTLYFDLDITSELIGGKIFSKYSGDWYDVGYNYGSLIVPVSSLNGKLTIKDCYVNNAIPAVVYFSGYPSSSTRISYGPSGTSDSPTTHIENYECVFPSNCKYVLLQAYILKNYMFKYERYDASATSIISNYTLKFTRGKAWNTYINNWYQSNSMVHAIIKASKVKDLLWVKHSSVNNTTPAVCYFSGEPSSSTYIGCDALGTTGSVKDVYNVLCNIPANCEVIVLQGMGNDFPSFMYQQDTRTAINDALSKDMSAGAIEYSAGEDGVYFSTKYGEKTIRFEISKVGPNSLPDFNTIYVPEQINYSHVTDFFGPFIVKAKENGDGDDIENHTFTGGNHAYDNTGSSSSSATARCVSLAFFADGKALMDGDSGKCSILRIEWVNRIQGYNTRKSDGSGREILEEKHVLEFDGYEMTCTTTLIPLEDIYIETWYGYQAYLVNLWPNIVYIGATNRIPFSYSSNQASGNNTPNLARCYSSTDVLEVEIDRNYDVGNGDLYSGTSGFFTMNNKFYTYFIQNQELDDDCHYEVRGWYRFKPNSD